MGHLGSKEASDEELTELPKCMKTTAARSVRVQSLSFRVFREGLSGVLGGFLCALGFGFLDHRL